MRRKILTLIFHKDLPPLSWYVVLWRRAGDSHGFAAKTKMSCQGVHLLPSWETQYLPILTIFWRGGLSTLHIYHYIYWSSIRPDQDDQFSFFEETKTREKVANKIIPISYWFPIILGMMLVVWEGAFIKCFRGEPLQWRGLWMNYGFMHKIRPSLTYYLAERPKVFEIVRRRKFCRSSFQSLASIPIPPKVCSSQKLSSTFLLWSQQMLTWISHQKSSMGEII